VASKNSTKKQQAQAVKNTNSISKAASLNINSSLTAITQTSVKIQSDLSKIGEELIQKHAELQAVDEAIALKKEEMSNLHGVDNVLLSIDEAKTLHSQFVEEREKQKQQIELEQQELINQRLQERQREEEEYNYKLQLARKNETDAWNESIRVRKNQERDRQEAFEKDFAARKAALEAQEAQYQAALTKAATFDAEVDAKVKREVAIVTNTMNKDFKHQTDMTAVQHQSMVEKVNYDNKRLVEAANNYETQVKELQVQLQKAYEENAKLARAAVDGAANAKAQADALSTLANLGSGNGTRART
jgi:hypothetical protein